MAGFYWHVSKMSLTNGGGAYTEISFILNGVTYKGRVACVIVHRAQSYYSLADNEIRGLDEANDLGTLGGD